MSTGLTPFILAMMKAPPEALTKARADPGPLARKYEISPEHVAGYLREWVR